MGQEAVPRRRKGMRDRRTAVPRASSPVSRSGPRVRPSGHQAQTRQGHGQNARPIHSRSAIGSVPGADQGQGNRVRDEICMPRPVLPIRPASFPAPIGIRGAKAQTAADRPWRRAYRVGSENATVNCRNAAVRAGTPERSQDWPSATTPAAQLARGRSLATGMAMCCRRLRRSHGE